MGEWFRFTLDVIPPTTTNLNQDNKFSSAIMNTFFFNVFNSVRNLMSQISGVLYLYIYNKNKDRWPGLSNNTSIQ